MPGMFGGGGMSAEDMTKVAGEEARLNRTNTASPIYGGTQWTQGPNGEWTQSQTLSPYGQQRFDLAQQLMGRVGSEMQPLDTSKLTDVSMDPNYEANQANEAFKYSKGYLDPQWKLQEQQLKGQMAAQGAHLGDPAYKAAWDQFMTGKNQAYDQARSGSYLTGAQAGAQRMQSRIGSLQAQLAEQLQRSGWSLGQVNALMQGLPGAPGGNASPVSLLQPMLQQQMQNQQLQAQFGNNLIGGGMGILGGVLSDVNAKEDFSDPAPALEEFLESAEPAEYSYKPEHGGDGGRHISPMAQGLERSAIGRSMVRETPVGKVVDYGKSFGAVLASLSHLNKKLNTVMGL